MDLNRFYEPDLNYHVYVKDAQHFQKKEDNYDHWALFIVEDGSFDYKMGNQSGKAIKGDLVLCPPDLTFYRKTTGLSFHLMGFQWKHAPRIENSNVSDYPLIGKLRLLNNNRLNSTLSLFREANDLNASMVVEYKKHLLRDLMYVLQMETFNRRLTLLYSENPILQRALHMLRQQAEFGISLKSIAIELGISQVQLTRLFNLEFRITPSAYAANLRMEKVKILLVNTPLTLAQIAEHCGFTDEHHVSKSFKKLYGINPSTYRKTYRV